MNIRPATPDDIHLLSTLNAEVQRMHAERHPEVFKPPESDAFAEGFFREILGQEGTHVFIGEVNGEPVGYLSLRIFEREEHLFAYASRTLEIDQIGVRPAQRRKGYGARLVDEARAFAREKGIERVALSTWAFNTSAQGFFASQGFEDYLHRMWLRLD